MNTRTHDDFHIISQGDGLLRITPLGLHSVIDAFCNVKGLNEQIHADLHTYAVAAACTTRYLLWDIRRDCGCWVVEVAVRMATFEFDEL